MQRKFSASTTGQSRLHISILALSLAGSFALATPSLASPLSALLDPGKVVGKDQLESGILEIPEINKRIRLLLKRDYRKLEQGLEVVGNFEHICTRTGDYLVLEGNKAHAADDLSVVIAFDLWRDRINIEMVEDCALSRYFEDRRKKKVVGYMQRYPFEADLAPWQAILGSCTSRRR